ncbi:hypothetical protein HOP50_05g35960 [Chloropicon primus]|uniref:Uncharacterized protein n=1 Tax=Chloropicon primus TaxID=1764295 RepID=A0A5B8MLA6_9CHLO|nr:hypothetical protein A3770_05p35890 [Chloropicon primus]UPR00282.1 hypothetical protein HOP50_05g35960 [Chloropicon primus]|eukprot:QDZ21071.1 hypothetical protein A3770_05p35890 [Chloropicon primus]
MRTTARARGAKVVGGVRHGGSSERTAKASLPRRRECARQADKDRRTARGEGGWRRRGTWGCRASSSSSGEGEAEEGVGREGDSGEGEDFFLDDVAGLWGEQEVERNVEDAEGLGISMSEGETTGEGDSSESPGSAPRSESWRSEGSETAARKKGRTWHKYSKATRELKRLQNLLPDLEGGSLFADELGEGDLEALGDLDEAFGASSLESPENLRNLEQQLERSGFAYIAKGGKPTNIQGVVKNLGWAEEKEDAGVAEEKGGLDMPSGGSFVIDDETASLFEMERTEEEVEGDERTRELRARLDAMQDHPWKNSVSARPSSLEVEEIESTLVDAEEWEAGSDGVGSSSSSAGPSAEDGGRAEWLEYENPPELKPAEQRILEKAMFSSTIRMIHDQEQQSMERARVTWYLKEQFNSEFVLSNYLAHMARAIQDEVDGIEIVNYKETGTFIARYKPMIMSKVLFDLEKKLKSKQVDIEEINELQVQSNRKADLLEKSIAFLCDRSIRVQLAKHLRRNLSFKQDQASLPAEERLDLARLEETLGVERVEDMIVKREDEEAGGAEEETMLDFLLRGDTAEAVVERDQYATFKPQCEEDFLPDLPEDALIQFSIDGESVEVDLSKIGEQAVWIRQLLGYKKSDKEHMDNFDKMMKKTESAFQVRPKKRRDKRLQQRGGPRKFPEKDESRMFQDAVDIFESSSSNEESTESLT